jgi:SOS-response transcriptional repressor LexA
MLDNHNMTEQPQESAIYSALMAVKPEGMSLNQWSSRAGINRSIFNGIKRHGNPTSETLQKLLDAIGADLTALYAHMPERDPLVKTEVKGTGLAVHDIERPWRGQPRQKPVPLLGTAYGGEWSDGVEMTELHLSDVLDYLARPPSLDGDKDSYAVEIVGDSMAPRFEPRERVWVSPRSPVRPGDDVIVQLRNGRPSANEERNPNPDFADRVTMVLIKRLVRRTPSQVELQQFNPAETFSVPAERIAAIHRVRGRL